jgi:hypothetical protein
MLWATSRSAPGQRCGHEVLRSQAAHAGVALGSLRHLARIEARRQVGQLMLHDVRLRCGDRPRQRRRIEDIDHDGRGARGLQRVGFRCGAGRAGDAMASLKQKRHPAPADGTSGARQKSSSPLPTALTTRKRRTPVQGKERALTAVFLNALLTRRA